MNWKSVSSAEQDYAGNPHGSELFRPRLKHQVLEFVPQAVALFTFQLAFELRSIKEIGRELGAGG